MAKEEVQAGQRLAGSLTSPCQSPGRSLASYAAARVLEALLEGVTALCLLKEGLTRNAAGKDLPGLEGLDGALLALEITRVPALPRGKERRKWLLRRALPRIPTSRLRALG